jgi:hypothetical protein
MSDQTLVDEIRKAVLAAVQPFVSADRSAELDSAIGQSIADAVVAFRSSPAGSSTYPGTLGNFIIEQNPYAKFDDIIFPDFPLDPNGENRWVRRSGVLSEYYAGNPLPGTEPIPAGHVVHFSYSDWPHLVEPQKPLPEYDQTRPTFDANGIPEIPSAFLKPPAEVSPPAGTLPPDSATSVAHNIVKTVRLRYSFFDRRYPANSELAHQYGRDRHSGFILICYSGGDHG